MRSDFMGQICDINGRFFAKKSTSIPLADFEIAYNNCNIGFMIVQNKITHLF